MVRRRFERIAAAFGNLSLAAKGVSVVAIPVAALLVAMAVFYLLEQQTRQARDWVEHTFLVRADIERVMMLLARAETTEGYRTADPRAAAVAGVSRTADPGQSCAGATIERRQSTD